MDDDAVSKQQRPIELWPRERIVCAVFDEVLVQPRVRLTAACLLPGGPGFYLIFYKAPNRLVGPGLAWLYGNELSKGRFPVYAGSTTKLRGRVAAHLAKASNIPSLGWGADLFVTVVATDHVSACYAEGLLIERLRPVWNIAARGWGSRSPGAGRPLQRTSDWSLLHPMEGQQHEGEQLKVERLIKRVQAHAAATTYPTLWPKL